MEKLIVVAGMPRSGSTWMFNVCRLAMEKAGSSTYGAWIQEYDSDVPAAVHVVKIHHYSDEPKLKAMPSIILTSWRELHGTMKSLKSINASKPIERKWFKNLNELENLLNTAIDYYPYWAKRSNYEMRFDRIHEKQYEAEHLAKLLNINLSPCEIANVVQKVDQLELPDRSDVTEHDHDPITLLHPAHTKGGISLDAAELDLMQRLQSRWPEPKPV